MRETIEILGAGGHASVVVNVAHRAGTGQIRVWYEHAPDPRRFPEQTAFEPVSKLPRQTPVLLGMGNIDSRKEWRVRYPTIAEPLVDPSAIVGHGVRLARGVVVMPGVIVNPNSAVAEDAILNTGCIIEHDCYVGQNTHIAPTVCLGGGVVVGANTLVGTGATVLPRTKVGASAVIGAGAVVIRDIQSGQRTVGVPARVLDP